jgi:hypothetical protein
MQYMRADLPTYQEDVKTLPPAACVEGQKSGRCGSTSRHERYVDDRYSMPEVSQH